MDIQRLYQELYNSGMNQGMAEGFIDPENLMASGNVSNTTYFPRGLLSVAGAANVEPTADKAVNPFIEMLYRDKSGLEANATVDNYAKSIGAGYGNNAGKAYANITQTDNDLIKQLGLQGQNFGANVSNSNQGTEFGLNALLNMFGGQASAAAYKNPEDKGFRLNFTKGW